MYYLAIEQFCLFDIIFKMSSFRGQLVDPALNFLAIDFFGKSVHSCEIFFLSHHHADHIKGLDDSEFYVLVNTSPTKILYCSPITANFLRQNRRCFLNDSKIVPIELNKPRMIQHEFVKTNLVVTSLPASHCPGAVMFLFEYEGKRILYSGDIRLTEEDLNNIVGTLTNLDGSSIKVDDLYLDTTFAASSQLEEFPSREESELTIIDFVEQYLSVSSERRVAIQTVAKFGYESLFIKLRKAFKTPVIVHEYIMNYYKGIEQIQDYVSTIPDLNSSGEYNWLIHACYNPRRCDLVNASTLIIKPCARSFVTDDPNYRIENYSYSKYGVPFEKKTSDIKVFYSTHCSLNELQRFYTYLKPERVFPSVIESGRSLENILTLIGANCKDRSPGLRVLPSHGLDDEELKRRSEIRKELKFD